MEDIGGTRELGGSASGFDGFEEIMELYLQRARCDAHAHARDPDAHLTLDTSIPKMNTKYLARTDHQSLGISLEYTKDEYQVTCWRPSNWLEPERTTTDVYWMERTTRVH